MNQQKYTVELSNIVKPQQDVASNCNSIMFINKGAVTVYVEEFPLGQNESLVIDGNAGEFCTRTFKIKNNQLSKLWVIRKIYTQ